MEPTNANFTPLQELPAPVEPGSTQPEQVAAQPEVGVNQSPVAPPVATSPPSLIPPASVPPNQPPLDANAVSASTTDNLIADDSDLIEKEWVMKAKAIVAQTKNDPYVQNKSMTRVKADYLKKRYNKDLKVSEG